MAKMNMIQAIRSALDCKMADDPTVLSFGEDAGYFGGVFRCTEGLHEKYGAHRSFDTPISESGIVGIAVGMAANGLRPVAEIQFADYIYPAYDQIASEVARLRHRSAGDFSAPLVIRTPTGGGIYGGNTHSQSPEALFTHICGLKTVIPSNPIDAKGMLITAIEDNDPVLFLEPKRLYNGPFDGDPHKALVPWSKHQMGDVEEDIFRIPFGKANVVQEGNDVTILTYATHVWASEAAARKVDASVEIIDLRSLVPLDLDTIVKSVNKTGRCIVVHEATQTSGFGAEVVAQVQEECFFSLESPIVRVAGWDTPYPHAMEWQYFPGQDRIIEAINYVLES